MSELFNFNENDQVLEPTKLINQSLYSLKISQMSKEERKSYLESGEFKELVRNSVVSSYHKTHLVNEAKEDDLEKQIGVASCQIASNNGCELYEKLKKNREEELDLLKKIKEKYGEVAKEHVEYFNKKNK